MARCRSLWRRPTARGGILTIAQRFNAVVLAHGHHKVPLWTKGPCGRPPYFPAVPRGTFYQHDMSTSLERLGYYHKSSYFPPMPPRCARTSWTAIAMASHLRFRRLTLRSATGTAQRACPYQAFSKAFLVQAKRSWGRSSSYRRLGERFFHGSKGSIGGSICFGGQGQS